MTSVTEHDFVARIQRLIADLASHQTANLELQRRSHGALMEGYGRALALEGERRRLRERQLELADRQELDADGLRELSALARHEARLARKERELRGLLAPLRERGRVLWTRPITG